MVPPAEDFYCYQFQPNPFDLSRCGTCLRPHHMHPDGSTGTAIPLDQSPEWVAEDDEVSEGTSVASSDDLSRGWTYEWTLVHSLSPEEEPDISDSDIQSSFQNQCDSPEPSSSCAPQSNSGAPNDMTRLDPSPHQGLESSRMDERSGRDRSRRPSESRGVRNQESGYFSPDRHRVDREQHTEEVNKRAYRYYERGHPLPSNYVLEPKATVPFRTVNLGVPSQRRNRETYMLESWRSESPQRYTYHSNFRRGTDSERNSPTRHSSLSPDRYKSADSQRWSSLPRGPSRSHASSHLPSHAASRHTSGRSSPRRRGSVSSRAISPPRVLPSRKHSHHSQNGGFKRRSSQDLRSPSQASNKHSLDSEKLYRNLESISRRASSSTQQNSYKESHLSPRSPRSAVPSLANTRSHNSREVSPPRNDFSSRVQTPQRELCSRNSHLSPSPGSWQGSSPSMVLLSPSGGSSLSRQGLDSQRLEASPTNVCTADGDGVNEANDVLSAERSRSNVRRGMEAILLSEPKISPVDVEETGMSLEDYVMLADIPKIQLESEEELSGFRRRNQSPSPCREQRLRSHRYLDEVDVFESTVDSNDRGRGRERGRDRRERYRDLENGRSSRRQSVTSIQGSDKLNGKHRSSTAPPERPQTQMNEGVDVATGRARQVEETLVCPDALVAEVLQGLGSRGDDPEGEIDLTSCVTVSDCDVEKNYGLQIHTKRAVFTLSATTSRIRRNWVKLLQQVIRDNTYQSGRSSEKENPLSRGPSSCQPPAGFTCADSGSEHARSSAAGARSHRAENQSADVDLDLSPSAQREEGEGWDREQAKRLEERNKWFEEGVAFTEMGSRWDSMELKKGSVPVPVIETMDLEVNRKWNEFESLSFRDMSAQSLIGAQTHQSCVSQEPFINSQTRPEQPEKFVTNHVNSKETPVKGFDTAQTNKVLQKEAESVRRDSVAVEVDSPCGPGAPCRAKLKAMVEAHRKAVKELQGKHAVEIKELEEARDKMLQEESHAAAKAMESLQAAHRAELERAVEKRPGSGHVGTTYMPHVLHEDLDGLSEQYSQKCLELSRTEESGRTRATELGLKDRELEQLRRENQELKAKLAEEISRMRYFITGQRSDVGSRGNTQRSASDIETLIRAKENEVQALKREIGCLQSEAQSLTKEKEASYERYKEAYVELSDQKGRSRLEMDSLKQHLSLTNAALQEQTRHT